ncbi:MAG: hypothetical protein MMC33_002236 [Icmadophila ericetorum]|nr:hypothetical protein [Icmadophila ericetorum]
MKLITKVANTAEMKPEVGLEIALDVEAVGVGDGETVMTETETEAEGLSPPIVGIPADVSTLLGTVTITLLGAASVLGAPTVTVTADGVCSGVYTLSVRSKRLDELKHR